MSGAPACTISCLARSALLESLFVRQWQCQRCCIMKRLLFSLIASIAFASAAVADPLVWHGKFDIASGRGEKGPWQQNNSRYNYVDDATVTIDQQGNVDMAWVDQGRKDVFFQRLASDGRTRLAEPVNVSRSPDTFSWLPRMARAPDAPETIYVLWQEIIFSGGSHGGDILFARSDDNGVTFSKPVNLSNSIGGDGKGRINRDIWHNGSYDMVAGPDGLLYAAWTEYDGPLWFIRSIDSGKTFSRPQRIADGAKPARAPSLALGKNRALYLAWTTGDGLADIHVAKSEAGGAGFGNACIVAPDDAYSDAPKLVASPDGVLHLVYAQSSGGPFEKYQIRYTRSSDGCNFEAPREISSPLPDEAESAAYPSLSIDAAGRLYILFELFPDYRERPHGLGITVSADGGNSFSKPASVPYSKDPDGGANGSHQGLLMKKLAVNDIGAVAVVNSSLKHGKGSRVWLILGTMEPVRPLR
jgi:hypothetical protein